MLKLDGRGGAEGRSRGARLWLATFGAALALCTTARPARSTPLSIVFHGVVSTVDTGSTVLVSPSGLAIGSDGTLYVADFGGNQVVRIGRSGAVDVLVIPSLDGPEGLALDAAGNLYVTDSGNDRIVEYTPEGLHSDLDLGSITLSSPRGVTVDRIGTIYIADTGNDQIVQLPAGSAASVLGVTGLTLSAPSGITSDPSGNLYVTDSGSRVVEVADGVASAVSFGASLDAPLGLAIDPLGTIYVANQANDEVAEHALSGGRSVLDTASLSLSGPSDVASDAHGVLYVSDNGNGRVRKLMPSTVDFGHVALGASVGNALNLPFSVGSRPLGDVTVVTSGAEGSDFQVTSNTCTSGASDLDCVVSIEFNPSEPGLRRGAITLSDNTQEKLITVPLLGIGDAPVAALAGSPSVIDSGEVSLVQPFQVAFDGAGNMYVADYGGHRVLAVPPGGGSATIVDTGSIVIDKPTGVVVDSVGNLYIAEYDAGGIAVVTPEGEASELDLSSLDPPLLEPVALAVDANRVLYVADWINSRVVKVSPSGRLSVLDTGELDLGSEGISGVAVDSKGNVYLVAMGTHVFKITPAGSATEFAIPGFTFGAFGVAVDAFDNVYVVDVQNRRMLMVTVTGDASAIPLPDGMSTTSYNLALDSLGNLYIPAFFDAHIVRLDRASVPLAFPDTFADAASSEQTTTLTNIGNLPLTFGDDGGYPPAFPAVSDELRCRAISPLGPGGSCLVAATFEPTTVGSYSATIVLTDDSLNQVDATQGVAASGVCTPDSTSLDLASNVAEVELNHPVTLTATITDSVSERASVIPTGSVIFTDTFGSGVALNGGNPVALDSAGQAILEGVILDAAGAHDITANFASDGYISSSNTTTVVVTTAPVFAVAPADPFDFGSHPTGSHTVQTFTITNAGTGVLDVGAISLSGSAAAEYSVVPNADFCTNQQVAAEGGSCRLDVSYDPTDNGASTVALTIPNSAGTQYVALSGTGRGSDLQVRIVGLSQSVLANDPVHYDVWVENVGGKAATAPRLSFTLPDGAAFVSANASGWTCINVGPVVECSRDTLGAGEIGILHFSLTAPPSAGTITSTFTASSTSADEDSENNSVKAETVVTEGPANADYWVTLQAKPAPVEAGSVLTYTLQVGNEGPRTAADVSVRFRLPSGVALLAASGDGWSCGSATTIINCTKATSLEARKSSTVLVTVTAPSTAGNLSASVTVASSTDDPKPDNDTAAVTTSVTPSLTTPLVPTSSLDPQQALGVQSQGGCTLSAGVPRRTGGVSGVVLLGLLAGFSAARRNRRGAGLSR